ncbi:hypothetical protein BGZ61DRAFT_443322 [Ilyonectria robusta]|uniref:uncharacterized protein n=1 Tax=Ilyonectria robusta TaxID=1079257 RepID=UPI001E8DAB7D|nr:uncharacterized protein BGZ61DRAFT_443322 [Ilyonectria robusta]KAH8734894.1 hypothetical protein BGZ61DRAFT_443322 [Ilyonectria robusta]
MGRVGRRPREKRLNQGTATAGSHHNRRPGHSRAGSGGEVRPEAEARRPPDAMSLQGRRRGPGGATT